MRLTSKIVCFWGYQGSQQRIHCIAVFTDFTNFASRYRPRISGTPTLGILSHAEAAKSAKSPAPLN